VGAFAAFTSFVIFYFLKQSNELRVTEQEELEGLDAHEHGTAAYAELKYE
jgi:Amt family ammonium transporter